MHELQLQHQSSSTNGTDSYGYTILHLGIKQPLQGLWM